VTPPSSLPHPDDQTIEQLLGVGSGTWHGPEHVDYRRSVDVFIQQLEPVQQGGVFNTAMTRYGRADTVTMGFPRSTKEPSR
jgi:hypothetical protein